MSQIEPSLNLRPEARDSGNPPAGGAPGDGAGSPVCSACGRATADGRWFCRLPRERIVLCSPACALSYFDTLLPAMNGGEPDDAADEHSLHFVVDEEKPWR